MDQLTFEVVDAECELSKTERLYLPLIGEGLTKKEMAERLHKSEATVNSHVKNIQAKLGASNGPSLIAQAIAKGILRVTT